jgi:acetylornithine deacetylase/succinyl-diaminopimelate desuccinylase-like protein
MADDLRAAVNGLMGRARDDLAKLVAFRSVADPKEAFGRPLTTEGQGGSIPLCNVFADTFPEAEIMLLGVEEPKCLIHAPNESVDPSEIEHTALAEALFLQRYAAAGTGG